MKYFQIYAWTDCPFCSSACSMLSERGEQFMFSCLDNSEQLLNYYKTKYNWETVPLIILRHTDSDEEMLIGGFSDLQEYFRSTEQQDN